MVEGTALEMRQTGQPVREFESLYLRLCAGIICRQFFSIYTGVEKKASGKIGSASVMRWEKGIR